MKRAFLFWITVASMFSGCSTKFRETHYFKSVDDHGNTVNFYRVRVNGATQGSSARYLSGYFDESAVDAYFGELKQPTDGKFPPDRPAASAKTVDPVDSRYDGRRLVMILSTNSDAVASQIGGLVQSQELATAIGYLATKDAVEGRQRADVDLARTGADAQLLAVLGDGLVVNVTPANLTATRASLLEFANALASRLGSEQSFQSFAEVKKWLDENRTRILGD